MRNRTKPGLARSLALAAVVVALCASTLSARDMRANFTLPQETQWGSTVLPAGAYTLSFYTMPAWAHQPAAILRQGTRSICVLLPLAGPEPKSAGESHLILLKMGERAAVQSLYLEETGFEYSFSVPDSFRVTTRLITRARQPVEIERVPLVVSGK